MEVTFHDHTREDLTPTKLLPEVTPILDTDTDINRRRRAERQYWLEKLMTMQLYDDKPLSDRHSDIRRRLFSLFGIDRLDNPSTSISPAIRHYPERKLVPRYIQALAQIVDNKNAQLALMPEGETIRQEKGFRIAVLVYVIGVTIHQDVDGNGQTQRLLALSYVWEHCPQFAHHFLPIKYGQSFEDNETMSTFEVSVVNSGLPLDFPPEQRRIYDFIAKIRQLDKVYDMQCIDDSEAAARRFMEQLVSLVEEIRSWGVQIEMKDIQHEIPSMVSYNLRVLICRHLKSLYPEWSFSPFGTGMMPHETKEFILNILLSTQDGLAALDAYVDDGAVAMAQYVPHHTDPRIGTVIESTYKALSVTEKEIERLLRLETEEVHTQKHDQHTK